MDMRRLLLVEDEPDIGALLAEFLMREGFEVRVLADGRQVAQTIDGWRPDLLVLDIMLPGEDGLSICRRVRQQSAIPIIMLTARSADAEKITGLDTGADDYLGKPFNPRELLARIKAQLRRAAMGGARAEGGKRKRCGDIIVDLDGRSAITATGVELTLTTAEFDLLACLIERPRRVLSRDQLLDWTRGRRADPLDRTIDVTVSRLRARLQTDAPLVAAAITTVRNGGYLLQLGVEDLS